MIKYVVDVGIFALLLFIAVSSVVQDKPFHTLGYLAIGFVLKFIWEFRFTKDW